MMSKVCVVMGVGPGNGEAFLRRFCSEGYQVAMLALPVIQGKAELTVAGAIEAEF